MAPALSKAFYNTFLFNPLPTWSQSKVPLLVFSRQPPITKAVNPPPSGSRRLPASEKSLEFAIQIIPPKVNIWPLIFGWLRPMVTHSNMKSFFGLPQEGQEKEEDGQDLPQRARARFYRISTCLGSFFHSTSAGLEKLVPILHKVAIQSKVFLCW